MSRIECLTDDRLQSVVFDSSPLSHYETAHLRTCGSCQSLRNEYVSMVNTFSPMHATDDSYSVQHAIAACRIARKVQLDVEELHRRVRLVTVWGAFSAMIALVLLPSGNGTLTSLFTPLSGWAISQTNQVEQFYVQQVGQISETWLLVFAAMILVLASDLLQLRSRSRQNA